MYLIKQLLNRKRYCNENRRLNNRNGDKIRVKKLQNARGEKTYSILIEPVLVTSLKII